MLFKDIGMAYCFTLLKSQGKRRQSHGGLAFPTKSLEKKALALLPSLPQPMRNFIPFVASDIALVNSEGEKKSEERKEEKK